MFVRPLCPDDLEDLLALARAAGTGMTNLPPDRASLGARITRSMASLEDIAAEESRQVLLGLDVEGVVRGTGALFSRIGSSWPFYSYRISQISQTSVSVSRHTTFSLLMIVNDLDGSSEVGGLLVDPALRRVAAGRLMARSRYLFIALHRSWFADHVIADLRGMQDAIGHSPFWDAVGRHFYNMSFEEADQLNGRGDNQFIADLGPRYPIYINLLPQTAQDAIGRTHEAGSRALDLLVEEGFERRGYVDIFDAGPTLCAATDMLAAVRACSTQPIHSIGDWPGQEGEDSLIAAGHAQSFRCTRGLVAVRDSGVAIDSRTALDLNVLEGDEICYVPF